MNSTPTTTAAEAAVLRVLAASPLAKELQGKVNAERAAARAAILATMTAARAAAQAEQAALHRRIVPQEKRVEAAHAAYLTELTRLRELNGAHWEAGAAADRAVARARQALSDTASLIQTTANRARQAFCQSLSLITIDTLRDPYGRVVKVSERDPMHGSRAARMRDLADELDALLFDSRVTPSEIEARCAAAIGEIDGGQTLREPGHEQMLIPPPFLTGA